VLLGFAYFLNFGILHIRNTISWKWDPHPHMKFIYVSHTWSYGFYLKHQPKAHILKTWSPAVLLLGSGGAFEGNTCWKSGLWRWYWDSGLFLSLFWLLSSHELRSFLHYILPAMTFCLTTGLQIIESTDQRLKPLKLWSRKNSPPFTYFIRYFVPVMGNWLPHLIKIVQK
jgi:hypothetical protein